MTRNDHLLSTLPPDAENIARNIATICGVEPNMGGLILLILLDDAYGDNIQIEGRPEIAGPHLRDGFAYPGLLDIAGAIPSVQAFVAKIQPPSQLPPMTPEAEELFTEWIEGKA
jgi:hypothetical protein